MVYATEEGVKDYLRTLQRKEYDPLTKKEEQKLLMRYKQNNDVEARNMLVSSNLRYACSLVNSYVGRGLSYSELISEANNGLIESIDKFDTKYDIKLFSYSKWWIMQRMQAAIDKKNKMPSSELPSETSTEDDEVFDNALADENDGSNDKTMPKEFEIEDDEACTEADRNRFVNDLLKILSKREVDMINRYFGRGYEGSFTLAEIGEIYGITKERVRQIIETAIRKVRAKAVIIGESYTDN